MPPPRAPITPAIYLSATTTSTHSVDTSAAATISVDNIADDIINATEAAGTVAVTGSVGGDAAQNTVSFTINGTAYSGTVDSEQQLSPSTSRVRTSPQIHPLMPPSQAPITPANSFSTTTSTHSVDTSAAATISVDTITADDIINATEAAGTVAVTGSVGGDAAQGDTVSFTINGTAYSGTVDSSSNFSIDVAGSDLAADTSFDAHRHRHR